MLLPGLLGSTQIAPAAPPPNMGPVTGIPTNPEAISALARQNNFGSGIFGSTPVSDLASGSQAGNSNTKGGGFFDNLDKTLSSPSKTLGIGLLGQLDPRLALAGLIASGFMNGR